MTSSGDPHRLHAQSTRPEELFEEIARQTMQLFIHPSDVGEALREKISVEGESLEQLVREWVTALLDLVRLQHMVCRQIRITQLKTPPNGPYTLQAEALGELLDPHRHGLNADPAWLKCRRAQIRKEPSGYQAEIELG